MYELVSVYRFWSDGLRARLTAGQFFWNFDIRHLLDLVKSYSHIEGMAERLRIHVFDTWLFQKMHSELAALTKTCVLAPNPPDSRELQVMSQISSKRFAVCAKCPFRDTFPEFAAILMVIQSMNHPFTFVTLLTLSRSVNVLAPWFQGR